MSTLFGGGLLDLPETDKQDEGYGTVPTIMGIEPLMKVDEGGAPIRLRHSGVST